MDDFVVRAGDRIAETIMAYLGEKYHVSQKAAEAEPEYEPFRAELSGHIQRIIREELDR